MIIDALLGLPFLTVGVGGTLAIVGGALALGIRHGFDWDHIAAIADITSTTATEREAEPAIAESRVVHSHAEPAWAFDGAGLGAAHASGGYSTPQAPSHGPALVGNVARYARLHRTPLFLGSMYALGHGSMVVALGLLAILFKEFLPEWVDPIMERIVGATLILLAAYLFYSVYRYTRGGEFRLRSRWMLVFAGVGRAWRWVTGGVTGHAHDHAHHHIDQRYGTGTAYSIGLLHGIGAETGTQVLIIGAAVGAASTGMSVATLLVFVVGLLISNSVVTVASTTGFISMQRRQVMYVAVGVVAAVFSLAVGLVFLAQSGDVLPSLDPFVRWIGGPA